jgi:protoporphyrinogen oxidase
VIVILGGGIAGLSAAETLRGRTELPIKLLERDAVIGGASRTVRFGGFRYDLGGHRFYTRKANVQALVERLVGPDLLTVDRVSHIYFRGKMVDYPLTAMNALSALGWGRAFVAGCGYFANRVKEAFRPSPGLTFEQWAVSRFGRPLYRAYFKGYTEKLWGVPCDRLSADFAEQRIKGLSLREVIRDALFKRAKATTLVRHFLYPRLGFGMIPEAMAAGWQPPNELLLNSPAEKSSTTARGSSPSNRAAPASP